MRILLAGNPNSGKTTMFNAFTSQKAKVGNWGGVTVGERKAPLKGQYASLSGATIVDLPGAYSMSPFSPEESVTSEHIRNTQSDVIINIIDATTIGRSLFFTTQLLELGIPVVVALNKSDIAAEEDITIDAGLLSQRLGCPVIKTVSTQHADNGLEQVIAAVASLRGAQQIPPYRQGDIDLTDKQAVDAADHRRFAFVNDVVADVEVRHVHSAESTFQDSVDALLANKFIGISLFAAVMFGVFSISQTYVGPYIADWLVGWIEALQGWVAGQLEDSPALLSTVLADGIIGGVGAVIGFLPLVMVMYFLIALLEESGYMARVSAVLDPIFKHVGLSGKSVIPIVISSGCAVPGIMSARTIRDDRERRATAMLASFIPCGAKIPVIALFAGAFFNGAAWVSWVSYFLGLLLIFFGALVVKAVTGFKYRHSFFIMEFPRFRVPSVKHATISMFERAKAYIIKAATIILLCNLVVQVMQTFNWSFEVVAEDMQDTSILASIASPVAFLFIPLGFGTWQLAAAAVTGFIAKENVVGTIAVVFSLTSFIDTDELVMVGGANEVATVMGLTSVSALSYLFFNLYTPPCFAAIGAMNSEMRHTGWLLSAVGLQVCTGYIVAFLTYQVGSLIIDGQLGHGFVPGLIAVCGMVGIVILIGIRIRSTIARQYALQVDVSTVS
ncbi:ferrous iron transport protein B [Arcanobacterium phocae]|uniref:ferrous iron transport protein B n=1 Tax=Arcanobacterium phocae TaxID=131112 RepID=UPI001C0F37D4|nr:ferrous iron transport protein B [Arcanobacterium phocae]